MALESFKKTACCFLAALFFSFSVFADTLPIAILAPSANFDSSAHLELSANQGSSAFDSIIEGIKLSTPELGKEIRLLSGDNQDEIKKWLEGNDFLAVVTIGHKTSVFADSLSIPFPVITTATLLATADYSHYNGVDNNSSSSNNSNSGHRVTSSLPDEKSQAIVSPSLSDGKNLGPVSSIPRKKTSKAEPGSNFDHSSVEDEHPSGESSPSIVKENIYGGVSLSIAENVLKNALRAYLPHIKTLYVGDEGDNIIWFSDGLDAPQIIRHKIGRSQKSIVQFLWKTINQVDPKTEAVWVNANIEHFYLYKLSERAWERNVTLISNNTVHLESGTLLAVYPDFKGMGQRTGDLLSRLIKHKKKSGAIQFEPLRAVHQGINLRTAQHLGIETSPLTETDFSVIIK